MPQPPPSSTRLDDDDFDRIHAVRRRAQRKALWWLSGGFVLLFALAAWGFIADEPPPDTSDLRVVFKRPPEEQNAYALLAKLTATLPPKPKDATPEERHFTRIFASDADEQVAWNQTIVADVLRRYPADLADQVRAALAAPESESPEIKSMTESVAEVGPFRHLGQALTQQATLAWRSDDHLAAADLNLLALRFAKRVSQSRGYIITVLTGTGIQGIALDSIRDHVDSPTISVNALRRYVAELPAHEIAISDYHHAYKLEHTGIASLLLSSFDGNFSQFTGSPKAAVASLAVAPGFYQPNRTIRWHAEFIRAHATQPEPLPPTVIDQAAAKLHAITEAPWPGRMQNVTGRMVLRIVTPTLDKTTATCHRGRANLRLTRIYAALRLYQLEHDNALPADLAELVPACFPAVPLDPFGGQPLRYDRALTTIWSIDRKHLTMIDADGDFPERGMPAHRLRFARPPVELPVFTENPEPAP